MTHATSALHHPWIPVIRDGQPHLVTVREALVDAHRIDRIDGDLVPVEREALYRWLEALTAAVLHGLDPDDIAEDVAEGLGLPVNAVDAFLTEHEDRFDLAHPDTPFMQEWHLDPAAMLTSSLARDTRNAKGVVTTPDGARRGVGSLSVRRAGSSSSQWGVSDDRRDATSMMLLPLLLVTFWYSTPSWNAAAAPGYRLTRGTGAPGGRPDTPGHIGGAIGVAAGASSTFHLRGRNFAETLLLNVPRAWLTGDPLPVWLDQDHVPAPDRLADASSLWRGSWATIRPVLAWEGGRPVAVFSGTTMREVPPVAPRVPGRSEVEYLKDCVKVLAVAGDTHRVWNGVAPKPGQPRRNLRAPKDITGTLGFVEWYGNERDRAFAQWPRHERVMAAGNETVLSVHNVTFDGKGMTREGSEWTELPLSRLSLPLDARLAFVAVVGYAQECGKKVNRPLAWAADGAYPSPKHPIHPLTDLVKLAVFAALDDVLVAAQKRALDGFANDGETQSFIDGTKDRIEKVAVTVFAERTEVFLAPSTYARVERARSEYARAVRAAKTPDQTKGASGQAPTDQHARAPKEKQ